MTKMGRPITLPEPWYSLAARADTLLLDRHYVNRPGIYNWTTKSDSGNLRF